MWKTDNIQSDKKPRQHSLIIVWSCEAILPLEVICVCDVTTIGQLNGIHNPYGRE